MSTGKYGFQLQVRHYQWLTPGINWAVFPRRCLHGDHQTSSTDETRCITAKYTTLLSACRWCPCQTTAFRRHSNTVVSRTRSSFGDRTFAATGPTSLEQSAAQSQTMWAVIRPVQAVTEDIFIRTVRPRRSVFLTAPNRNILTYLLTSLSPLNKVSFVL